MQFLELLYGIGILLSCCCGLLEATKVVCMVHLHYAFDLWIEAWRQKVATGDVIVVRYADDLVVGFENRTEAERFLEASPFSR